MRKPFMPFEEGSSTLRMPILRDFNLGGPTPADSVREAIKDANEHPDMLMGRCESFLWVPVFPRMKVRDLNEITARFRAAANWYFFVDYGSAPIMSLTEELAKRHGVKYDLILSAARLFRELIETPEGQEAGKRMMQNNLLVAFEICNRLDPLGEIALTKLGTTAKEHLTKLRQKPHQAAA